MECVWQLQVLNGERSELVTTVFPWKCSLASFER